MRVRLQIQRFVAISAMVSVLLGETSVYAYGRSSHQHMTEIGYGLLKDMGACQLTAIEDASYHACLSGCTRDPGEKPDQGTNISPEVCKEECREEFWAPSEMTQRHELCQIYEEVSQLYPSLRENVEDTGEPKSYHETYYRLFRAKACPPTELYSYKLEGSCERYDLLLENGGYDDDDSDDPDSLLSQSKPLQSYTRVQYGGVLVASKDDNDYSLLDPALSPIHRVNYEHLPILATTLGETNFVSKMGEKGLVDLTGSILGAYSGSTDLYDDLFTAVHFFPLVQDVIKTVEQLGATGLITASTVFIAVAAIPVCGVWSALDWLGVNVDGEKCWSGTFDIVKDNLQNVKDTVLMIEEQNFLSTNPTSSTFTQRNTSMFHFMNTPLDYASLSQGLGGALRDFRLRNIGVAFTNVTDVLGIFFDHDDIDGYRPGDAYGFWLGAAGVAFETLFLDQMLDVRVDYAKSKPALLNYQVDNPDDGRDPSSTALGQPFRKVFYWHRQGLLDYTFPPVDNLAYYWWHVWWRARTATPPSSPAKLRPEEEIGLVPLGSVLHAVQDVTQPLHARGVSVKGHKSYELNLDELFDETLYRINHDDGTNLNKPVPDFILDLAKPDVERQFVEDVMREFLVLHSVSVEPTGVLQIRELMHELYKSSIEREFELPDLDDAGLVGQFINRLFSNEVSEYYTTRIGLVKATAATLLVLLEASRPDPQSYGATLDLTTFENFTPAGKRFAGPAGTVNSIVTLNQGLSPQVSFHDNPAQAPDDWTCAGNLPEAQQALQKYVKNQMSGRDLVATALSAQIHCSILQSGLPAPPTSFTNTLGRYKARQLEASTLLLGHGDLQRYAQDMACAQAEEWTDMQAQGNDTKVLVPKLAFARVQARCQGQLDSDGDGVFDQDDRCFTPPDLTYKGAAQVNAEGCLFTHDYVQGGSVSPLKSIEGARYMPTGGNTP